MGSFASGFAQAIGQHVHDRAEEQHKLEMDQKKALGDAYLQAIANTPDKDDPNIPKWQAAWENLYKGPQMKDVVNRARTVLAAGMHHPEWAPKTADQGNGSTPATPPPSASATGPGLPPPPPVLDAKAASDTQGTPGNAPPEPTKDPNMMDSKGTSDSSSGLPATGPESALAPDAGSLASSTNLTGSGTDTLQASLARPGAIPPPPIPAQPAPLPASSAPDALPPPPGQVASPVPQNGATTHASTPTVAVPAGTAPPNTPAWVSAYRAAHPSPSALQERAINLYQAQHDIMHRDKLEEVTAEAAARGLNSKPVFGPATSVLQARQLGQMGKEFLDQTGEPIDLATLPDGMSLKYMAQGSRHWYEPMSPNQRVVNVGGRVYAVNPADIADLTQGAGGELGVAHPGSTRTTPKEVISNGQPAFVPTTSSNTPNTPGVSGRNGVPPPPAVQSGAAATTPNPDSTHLTPPRTVQATPGASPNHKGGTIAAPPGTAATSPTTGLPKGSTVLPYGTSFPGQFTQQQKRNTAINDAGMALEKFAGPQDNGLSNLDVFKDPKGVQRLATYLRLNNDQIEGEFESAAKSGTEGVVSFYAGIPTAYAQQSTKAVKDAYDALTPAEKRFSSDYYFMLGNWGGMRAASGASGSQWNFRNLSQEVPNPMSITSYPEAQRKVKDLINEFHQVAKPNQTVRDIDENSIFPTQKKGSSASPAASPKVMAPPPGTPKQVRTADDFLSKHGVQ